MSPSFRTRRPRAPVSSSTSRNAVASARSPRPINPFGSAHVPSGFPAGRIAAATHRPCNRRTNTPPAENSRLIGGTLAIPLAESPSGPLVFPGTLAGRVLHTVTKSRTREVVDGSATIGRPAHRRGPRGGGNDDQRDRSPRYRQGKASARPRARGRTGQPERQGRGRAARGVDGRRDHLLEVRRHRDQGRYGGRADPARVRRARQGRHHRRQGQGQEGAGRRRGLITEGGTEWLTRSCSSTRM